MRSPETFAVCARSYVEKSLPHGSAYERQKLFEDWVHKERIADGIVADFRKRVGEPEGKHILDIGFGNGITLAAFAKAGAQMSGIEVSRNLFDIATEYADGHGIVASLHLYDGVTFPFPDATFDHIYSVSVLEHVSDPAAVLREAARVLKPGGTFYLAFPNRLNPKETHTGIWFISYFPRNLAQALLRFVDRNSIPDWNLHFISYFALRRYLRGTGLNVRYELHGAGPRKWLKQFLAVLGVHHSAFLPHIMVILEKGELSHA